METDLDYLREWKMLVKEASSRSLRRSVKRESRKGDNSDWYCCSSMRGMRVSDFRNASVRDLMIL